MAKTVKINNIAEFRTVAAEYGVAVPAGRGRPPAVKLAQAIVAAGDTIDATEYFTGQTEYKTVVAAKNVGKSEYVVTGTRQLVKDGELVTTKKGDPKLMPFKKTVTVGEVRAFVGQAGIRGRISGEAFVSYLSHVFGGGEVTIKTREKVGAPVAASQTADEPASDASEGENTTDAE